MNFLLNIKIKSKLTVLIVVCSILVDGFVAAGRSEQSLEPESSVQNQIVRTVSVVMRHWEKQASEKDIVEALEELEKTKARRADILPQLVLYRANVIEDEKKYHATTIILDYLFSKVSAKDTLEVMVPYLTSENSAVYQESRGMLNSLPSRHGDIKGDYYESFESYLKAVKDSPPEPLIDYMYGRLPDEALKTFAEVYFDKDEAKAFVDQVKGEDEAQAVDRLSLRSEWWAQLYAAEKMKQNPKLRDPELIEQLKKSKHAVVREAVRKIVGEKNDANGLRHQDR